jgi:DNA-binding transcriptional LysR family regulator
MSISYDYYKTFYYVATYHSFNKAASVLSISQPNLSRSITKLEEQLGCKLFNRTSTGVTLTSEGKDLFSHIEVAFRHISEGENMIRSSEKFKGGLLKIGISSELTTRMVSTMIIPIIHTFHKEYPAVRIEICHASSTKLASDVDNNLMDIAIVTTPYNESIKKSSYNKKVLTSYQDIIIAGNSFHDLKSRTVSLKELMNYPLISLGTGTETTDYCYRNMFSKSGLEFSPSIETTSAGQILIYTIENLGIGFIYPEDAAQAIEEGKIFKVDIKEKQATRYIAMLSNIREKNTTKIFEQMMNDQLSK